MSLDRPLQTYCSIEVAAHLAGVPVARVRRLVRAGLVEPPVLEGGRPLFGEPELARLRKIRRLTGDLGVNLAGVEVILRLTEELAVQRASARDRGDTSWPR
jgi:MerR family transcriptional regulator/heat shock protein HspR